MHLDERAKERAGLPASFPDVFLRVPEQRSLRDAPRRIRAPGPTSDDSPSPWKNWKFVALLMLSYAVAALSFGWPEPLHFPVYFSFMVLWLGLVLAGIVCFGKSARWMLLGLPFALWPIMFVLAAVIVLA